MAMKMKDLGIDRLNAEERLALVQEIWDSLVEEVEQAALTEGERDLLEGRLAAHEAAPGDVIPWEEVKARAMGRAGR
jgi:putative addiction module component (TIGR02574 family)